jgi:hypothetical protein
MRHHFVRLLPLVVLAAALAAAVGRVVWGETITWGT